MNSKQPWKKTAELKDRFQQENIYLRHEIAERKGSQIVNGSAAMRLILTQIRKWRRHRLRYLSWVKREPVKNWWRPLSTRLVHVKTGQ